MTVQIDSVAGLPEIAARDDLAGLIARQGEGLLEGGAVVCVAQKLVSKAEGRVRRLADVAPTPLASKLAEDGAGTGDARLVQVVLEETAEILRATRGVLITRTRHGFVCANAGVDRSNTGTHGDELAVLLPEDPDASARTLKARLEQLTGAAPLAVVITDSFGRAWRVGQVDHAIGVAGIAPATDLTGTVDRDGRPLVASVPALADELAAAAGLARAKGAADGVVVIRGLGRHVGPADGPGVAALIRATKDDLFR